MVDQSDKEIPSGPSIFVINALCKCHYFRKSFAEMKIIMKKNVNISFCTKGKKKIVGRKKATTAGK